MNNKLLATFCEGKNLDHPKSSWRSQIPTGEIERISFLSASANVEETGGNFLEAAFDLISSVSSSTPSSPGFEMTQRSENSFSLVTVNLGFAKEAVNSFFIIFSEEKSKKSLRIFVFVGCNNFSCFVQKLIQFASHKRQPRNLKETHIFTRNIKDDNHKIESAIKASSTPVNG